MSKNFQRVLFFTFFLLPVFSFAGSYGQKQIFFVEPNFDSRAREKILATNVFVSEKAYFYVEDDFWFKITQAERDNLFLKIKELASEFDYKIHPLLTQNFGKIEKGINGDPKVTILFQVMPNNVGGYTREADNYEKILAPFSNERKMIYLNTFFLTEPILKSNLAHEFAHLIIFDQKTKNFGEKEERWLQEIIAEISPTILGYGENLEKRIENFKKSFKDPVLEWKETIDDYSSLSIFAHYLLERFGVDFFSQILKTKETGVLAIEKISQKKFFEIFRNFAIANYLNNCQIDEQYCYKNEKLKKLKIVPEIQFLPIVGETVLMIFRETKDFSQNFYNFVGGKGNLSFEIEAAQNSDLDVSLIFCDKNENCTIQVLGLNELQKGALSLPNFTQNYHSFTALVFSKKSTQFVEGETPKYNFSIKVSFGEPRTQVVVPLPTPQPPIVSLPSSPVLPEVFLPNKISCSVITQNLRYGQKSKQVQCLQEFLKNQGPEIYPEGLVTGYFGPLTLQAVKKFQQKYWQEILLPWGLNQNQPTGFVGSTTRAKINQLFLI